MTGRFGVRSRIVAGSVAIVAVVMAALVTVVWRATSAALSTNAYNAAVATLSGVAGRLAHDDPRVALPEGPQPATGRAQQVLDEKGIVVAWSSEQVRDSVITVIYPTPGVGQVTTKTVSDLKSLGDANVLVAATKVTAKDGRVLTVVVAEPTSVQPDSARRLLLVAIAVVLAAFTVLVLVLRWAVGLALHPVDVISRELESINTSREARTVTAPNRQDEIGRLGRAVNELLARLHRSDAERAAFVSDAGHELRSPLATVSVSLELLSGNLTPARREVVAERASGELQRLSTLVEDLLALAKADESSDLVGATELDLDDLVLDEVSLARSMGAAVELCIEPVRLQGVPGQVQRIVRNLLENARRHASNSVRVELRNTGDEATLAIDNDGPPVALEDRERIFDRFVRLQEARDRDTGGSGLGLAIVRELTRRHGGTVVATDAPDGWCRFLVTLPTGMDAPASDAPPEPSRQTRRAVRAQSTGTSR